MENTEKRVAIYGAGAMGTVLGVWLTLGGVKVDLIARNEAHVSAINERGATVVCQADDKKILTAKAKALKPSEMRDTYDFIFLMTKQRENASIVSFLKERLKLDGGIITTQNGLPEQSIAEIVGKERTFGGVCAWGANFLGAGETELTSRLGSASIQIGAFDRGNPVSEKKAEEIVDLLSCVDKIIGAPFAEKTENLMGARWSKLAVNAAFSGLSVVTGLTFGEISKKGKLKKIAIGILRECFSVASAFGVTLEKMRGHDMEKLLGGRGFFANLKARIILPIAMKSHKKLVSGMLLDIRRGRKCEIDFICGAVVKVGAEVGVETPLCVRVVELAHGIENGLYEITEKNVAFFEN